jgi:hypothetical protein
MSIATFTWFAVGACVVYAVAADESIYTWLILQSKSLGIWVERQWFRLRYNPDSPWVRYEINRNANRIAKEIQSEMENKNNDNL